MNSREKITLTTAPANALVRLIVVLAITCAFATQALAQTAADTVISNTATATYSDGTDSFETASNTVTVTVAKVAGLTITPDVTDGSGGTVVPGQTGVMFSFTVTNTGNFTDNVRFKASGGSISVAAGMASVTSAFIDANGNGTYQAGTDTDILGNGADVVSANLAQNASLSVVVYVSVNAAAPAGSIIDVRLGDADNATPFDNEPIDSSAAEVRTEFATPVNGRREARGDSSMLVQSDAQLALSLTSPTGAGPVALGTNITYLWQLCNTGARPATLVTLTNAPGGVNTGVFIFAPVPAGTVLTAPQAFPAGTLYSDSALGSDPVTAATWYAVPTGTTTRVAFNVGASLGVGVCSASYTQVVTITTTNATSPITQQGIAYATNFVNQQITDLSDVWTTLLQAVGSVLNGPLNAAGAINTTNNDDFTNKSVNTGIAGIAPGGNTSAGGVVTFTNTVQNTGNANDTYTLTAQSYPAGSTVKITVNAIQTTVVSAGVPTGNAVTPLSIAFGATGNYDVEVTLPAGMTVLTGYDTLIRATSGNTPAATNDTIDRVYTGFIQLTKTATIVNGTGVGGATDPVPGAVIVYAITYQNVSSVGGGAGNVQLTASNIVISENGSAGSNNWAATTTMLLGAGLDPSDTTGGTITDGVTNGAVTAATNFLKDTIASLAAQQSGVFTFRRTIN